jgi:hypothetical protein
VQSKVRSISDHSPGLEPDPQGPPPKAAGNARRSRSFSENQWSRRSFMALFFVGGASVRHIAKVHGVSEADVAGHIREDGIENGALDRIGKLARKAAA